MGFDCPRKYISQANRIIICLPYREYRVTHTSVVFCKLVYLLGVKCGLYSFSFCYETACLESLHRGTPPGWNEA
jgi:hypothetical protein